MQLFKNFEFKGLFQAGKKMASPWGFWRRFTNTFKDRNGAIHPYGKGSPVANEPAEVPSGMDAVAWYAPLMSAVFRGNLFQLLPFEKDSSLLGFFRYLRPGQEDLQVVQPFQTIGESQQNVILLSQSLTKLPAGNFNHTVVNNKLFMTEHVDQSDFVELSSQVLPDTLRSNLLRFDGLRVARAGLPTPWNFCSVNLDATPDNRLRAVYMTIGLDAEVIFSPYTEVGATPTGVPLSYNVDLGSLDGTFTEFADQVGNAACFQPPFRFQDDALFDFGWRNAGAGNGTIPNYYDRRFVQANGTDATVTGGEITIKLSQISPNLEVGDWLMLVTGDRDYDAIYLQIKTIEGTSSGDDIVFHNECKMFDAKSVQWIDMDFDTYYTEIIPSSEQAGVRAALGDSTYTNIYLIISESNGAGTDPYQVLRIVPIMWEAFFETSVLSADYQSFPRPFLGVITSFMQDWYDTVMVKATFPPVIGITNYMELLVGFDKKAIYFHDVGLGGSTEMTTGLSNIVPYGTEYGDLTAICGSEDFLYFSRERKNYVIRGELTTGNISVTECDRAVPGAANARAVTNAWGGKVLFANAVGIFAVDANGGIEELSKSISSLFIGENIDENPFNVGCFVTDEARRTAGYDGGLFKFALDEVRGFILFLTGKRTAEFDELSIPANLLVYDTNDGSWYEFESGEDTSIESFLGKVHSLGVDYSIEDGVMRAGELQLLATTWMTADAPSLDKQVCQVKLYGEFDETTDTEVLGLTVGQQNNWQPMSVARSEWNTDAEYTTEDADLYYHKKRLDSSKPMATSVILESLPLGGFHLEGMEIEGVGVQEGMKK